MISFLTMFSVGCMEIKKNNMISHSWKYLNKCQISSNRADRLTERESNSLRVTPQSTRTAGPSLFICFSGPRGHTSALQYRSAWLCSLSNSEVATSSHKGLDIPQECYTAASNNRGGLHSQAVTEPTLTSQGEYYSGNNFWKWFLSWNIELTLLSFYAPLDA